MKNLGLETTWTSIAWGPFSYRKTW